MKVVVFHVKVPKRERLVSRLVSSGPFTIATGTENESTWRVECNLSVGLNKEVDGVGVFLTFDSGKIPWKVVVSFSIMKRNGNIEEPFKFQHDKCSVDKTDWEKCKSHGAFNVVAHYELYNSRNVYFPDGKLRILMKIITIEDSKIDNGTEFHSSFERLLDQEMFSDLTIRTSDDKQLKAHKTILSARSEVFARMLTSQMKENETGIIEISDDSRVVEGLLKYIYCNKVENYCSSAHQLYDAAKRYELKGLQILCLNKIYGLLDPENVLDVVIFADTYELKSLYKDCIIMIFA